MAEKRIARARNIDAFMTAVFYAIAIFFFTLLAAFAGKVIIGGLMGHAGDVPVCQKGQHWKSVV